MSATSAITILTTDCFSLILTDTGCSSVCLAGNSSNTTSVYCQSPLSPCYPSENRLLPSWAPLHSVAPIEHPLCLNPAPVDNPSAVPDAPLFEHSIFYCSINCSDILAKAYLNLHNLPVGHPSYDCS